MVSKQRRTETGSGQKRFQLIGQSWHVKKTCSENRGTNYRREEQIIGGKCAGSADEYAQKPRIARSSVSSRTPSFSLLCVPCHAIARALGRRFRCSLDDAREELT